MIKNYLFNILISIDQLVNALLAGDPDHTISGRMGKALANDKCRLCGFICGLLNRVQKDHCQKSIEWDEGNKAVWRIDK